MLVPMFLAGCAPVPLAARPAELEPLEEARRVCASGPTLDGIDVSKWQGEIDWGRVADDGIAFAIARVSDGTTYWDGEFDDNWASIADQGLVRGAYQFFRPGQSATAQADLMIDALGELGPGDLPPVLDAETTDGVSGSAVVSAMRTWLDRVEDATGRVPMIYASSGFWTTLPDTSEFSRYPLWVANWEVSCPEVPSPWGDWALWQTADDGWVDGISGPVDLDVFDGTMADLEALAGVPGLPLDIAWTRLSDGSYTFTTGAPSEVSSVEVTVDGYLIGAADRGDGPDFPVNYTFTLAKDQRQVEVAGFDANGDRVARGIGLLDVTAGTAVFVRQAGEDTYEMGLERAPSAVGSIEVVVDGVWVLTDDVSGTARPTRLAVRHTFSTLGAREFAISTFDAGGSYRGTLRRTFVLE